MTYTMATGPLHKKRATSSRPAYRASSSASVGGGGLSGSVLTVTIPATAQQDDYAIAVGTIVQTVTIATPAGWTLLRSDAHPAGGTSPTVYLWYKKLTSSDPGSTVTFTSSANAAWSVAISCYSNVGSIGVSPTLWWKNIPGTTATEPIWPAVNSRDTDLQICYGASSAVTLNGLTASQVNTPPAGFTLRKNISSQVNAISKAYSCHIGDGPPTPLVNGTGSWNSASYGLSGYLALSSLTEPATCPVPVAIFGKAFYGYGTSMLCRTNASVVSNGSNKNAISTWMDRLRKEIAPSTFNNLGIVGSESSTACTFAYGNFTEPTGGNDGDYSAIDQEGTWLDQADLDAGLVCLDLFGNDALRDGGAPANQTLARTSALNAGMAIAKLIRSASLVEDTDASIAYTGSWTAGVSTQECSSGTRHFTFTPGDKFVITTNETDLDIVLHGFDDGQSPNPGAPFTVTIDGVLFYTGSMSNQNDRPSNLNQPVYSQVCIPCYDLGAGPHTIEVLHTGVQGDILSFDCLLIPNKVDPPIIMINHPQRVPEATYGTSSSWEQFQIYGGIADTIADSFDDGKVVSYNCNAAGRYDYTTMVGADSTHLNEVGNAVFAYEIIRELKARFT